MQSNTVIYQSNHVQGNSIHDNKNSFEKPLITKDSSHLNSKSELVCPNCVICKNALDREILSNKSYKVHNLSEKHKSLMGGFSYAQYFCCSPLCLSWMRSNFLAAGPSDSGKEQKVLSHKRKSLSSASTSPSKREKKSSRLLVVLDVDVLLHQLRELQRLEAKGFVSVVVPLSVLRALDELKRSRKYNQQASHAICWIDQVCSGNVANKDRKHPFLYLHNNLQDLKPGEIQMHFPRVEPHCSDRVLQCCMSYKLHQASSGNKVVLLSEDTTLKERARSALDIHAFSSCEKFFAFFNIHFN